MEKSCTALNITWSGMNIVDYAYIASFICIFSRKQCIDPLSCSWSAMKPKEYFEVVKGEVRERHFWKSVRCEFLGTLLYVLFGCAATVTWNPDGHDPFKTPRVSASFGLVEFLLVSSLGHASGCQLNPALTVSLLCTRYITLFRTVCYLSVQLIAGLISSAILYGLVPEYSRHHLAVNEIGLGVTHAQAFGIEFLGTFIFVFSYFSSLRRKNEKVVPKALPCGVSITIAHLFAVRINICFRTSHVMNQDYLL